MAIFPGAETHLLTADKLAGVGIRPPRTMFYRVTLHVAAVETKTLYGGFNREGAPDSHVYVRYDGSIEQYVEDHYWAFADLEGNDASFSVESQGLGDGSWSDAQVESIAQIYAWQVATRGVPLRMATDSKVGESSHGLAWHRLGVDGNFPALPSPLAGREERGGGMHWSKSFGKVCPGEKRILQIPAVFSRAAEIVLGTVPVSNPIPAPQPAPAPIDRRKYKMDFIDLTNAHNVPVKGRHIDNLQGLLLAAGYGPQGLVDPRTGRPDGVGGGATRNFVGDWQRRTNTGDGKGNADYRVGDGTWTSLIEY